MTSPSRQTLAIADQAQRTLAGTNLPPTFARLYSQHTRLRAGRPPLRTWTVEESDHRLDDATGLLEIAFLQQETNPQGAQASMRRAAELLEWLSHPETNTHVLPLQLLSAAIYQLAAYPARASALLSEELTDGGESRILRAFLQGHLPALLQRLTDYWSSRPATGGAAVDGPEAANGDVQRIIADEAASSLGVLCAAFRWGEESRLDRAIKKLEAIAGVLLENRESFSWLLAKLCAAVAAQNLSTSMRTLLHGLGDSLAENGKRALERYMRLAYVTHKAVAWPSQAAGIAHLRGERSFVLCTPTGSGKTTVAELAILQRLFWKRQQESATFLDVLAEPLALYLVPSRALAAEVESKLSRVLRRLSAEPVAFPQLLHRLDNVARVWLLVLVSPRPQHGHGPAMLRYHDSLAAGHPSQQPSQMRSCFVTTHRSHGSAHTNTDRCASTGRELIALPVFSHRARSQSP